MILVFGYVFMNYRVVKKNLEIIMIFYDDGEINVLVIWDVLQCGQSFLFVFEEFDMNVNN